MSKAGDEFKHVHGDGIPPRHLLARRGAPPARWRVGQQVPINVYDGDRPVCQCHTAFDAKRIVDSVNAKGSELLTALDELASAIADARRRYDAGDSRPLNRTPWQRRTARRST